MVRLLAERAGAQVIDGGVIADDFESTRAAVEAGLGGDVLVVSGGVSVGPHDHVKPAFEACGVEELFWRVRVKPGKPLWFGRRGDTLVFGLPGNPLSSIVGFLAFIEPALRRMHGERRPLDADRARAADHRGRPVRRPHHVPHLAPRPRRPTACSRRRRPPTRARTSPARSGRATAS